MFDPLPDSPLTMGDLVGRSFREFRLHLRFFFSKFFWPCAISSLSMAGMKFCAAHWLEAHSLSFELFLTHWAGIFAFLIILLFAQWELSIRSLAIVRLLVLRENNTYAQALVYARRRKWAVMTIYNAAVFLPVLAIAVWAALVIGTIYLGHLNLLLRIVTSVVALVEVSCLTLSFSWAILWTSLSFSVLACEDLTFNEIVKRTNELTMRYLWRGGSFFCLLGFALIAVAVAMYMPIVIASLFEAATHGQNLANATYMTPLYLEILSTVWDSLLSIILLAVALLADGLYYNDLRLRSEGLDILNKLGKLKAQLLA